MHPALAQALAAAIETPRLLLEPMGERHAEAFFPALQADEPLYRWISMRKPASLDELRRHWRRNESRLSPDGQFAWPTWAVRRHADGQYLGRVDAEIDPALAVTNLGYYFFSPHWGQGYASEAVAAATEALLTRGVQQLAATVTAGNAASARVLRKAGFVFSRILPGNDMIRGQAVDDEAYVLTRPPPPPAP